MHISISFKVEIRKIRALADQIYLSGGADSLDGSEQPGGGKCIAPAL
jgi:hypothetical protein